MLRTFILSVILALISLSVSAGCMTDKITEINTKLEAKNISSETKQEVEKLLISIVANEHSDSETALKHYENAINLLN